MKKLSILFTVFTMVISFQSFAQDEKESGKGEFKKFKVDVSLGYALPTSNGGGAKGGALFAIEPKYAVMQNLSLGLRMEAAVMVSGLSSGSNNASAKAAGSYLLTGDYYFSDNNTRPFLGAGAGIFTTAAVQVTTTTASGGAGGSKFGGMIRGGMEYKHLRIGVEYNLVSKTSYTVNNIPPAAPTTIDIKNGYIGLKLGVVIGGGRK